MPGAVHELIERDMAYHSTCHNDCHGNAHGEPWQCHGTLDRSFISMLKKFILGDVRIEELHTRRVRLFLCRGIAVGELQKKKRLAHKGYDRGVALRFFGFGGSGSQGASDATIEVKIFSPNAFRFWRGCLTRKSAGIVIFWHRFFNGTLLLASLSHGVVHPPAAL